mgnify:FL=1
MVLITIANLAMCDKHFAIFGIRFFFELACFFETAIQTLAHELSHIESTPRLFSIRSEGNRMI